MRDDPRIEKIARAMCVADGIDPDSVVRGDPNDFRKRRGDYVPNEWTTPGPAWETYARHANLFLAAWDVMSNALHETQEFIAIPRLQG